MTVEKLSKSFEPNLTNTMIGQSLQGENHFAIFNHAGVAGMIEHTTNWLSGAREQFVLVEPWGESHTVEQYGCRNSQGR